MTHRSIHPGQAIAPLAVCLMLLATPVAGQETVEFTRGMVITRSVRIEPGTYTAPAATSPDSALITVRGDDLTVDMTGVELIGAPAGGDPDLATGVALRIEGGDDVTIRGATIRGYRVGILARGTRELSLVGNDVSYNWKPRLFSLVAHESLVDWMSFHQNEDREWMRFGSAIYLEDVTGGQIRQNRAVQGMNGLLMVRTDSVHIEDNELAFNSALGIGLYRSSHNVIVRNRLDFNVRGYSHGFYNRGQDSAGLLLYEQSSNNVIAYNSATHGGDGFFLWAGQSTMDTGLGGANDNLLFYNDFNFAPTNSVEITFSRNRVIGNFLQGSRYGIWGGYSWESEIRGNCFGANETGVAIEHGQDNVIEGNWFSDDQTAIQLWANASEPADWGYPVHRDTRSRGNRISGNRFGGHDRIWRLDNTSGVEIGLNRIETDPDAACDPRALLDDFDSVAADVPGVRREIPRSDLAGLDRSAMVVDEWGPYDWRSPKLWPTDTTTAVVPLRVLGPAGTWAVRETHGVADLSARSGRTGDTVVVRPSSVGDWRLVLEYVGGATTGPRGVEHDPGEAVPFSFSRFDPVDRWDVTFFAWTEPARDPSPASDGGVFDTSPILTSNQPDLDYMWYRPTIEELPQERWGLEARAVVSLEPGEYSLRTISDDGIRVWIDGRLVIDRFDPHGSEVDYAPLTAGEHDIRVQYFQIGGWSELRVDIVRGTARSRGSAGPH